MDTLRNMDVVVVKAGTNTLTNTGGTQETLNTQAFAQIGQEVRELSDAGTGVVLVTSAGITAGTIGDNVRREDITSDVELQRYAARGWRTVVDEWEAAIGEGRVTSALLTKQELRRKSTRSKTLGVIACCLAKKDIFVANENDVICDDEIKFGDNDTLAAEIAAQCAASALFKSVRLVLLTDVNGLRRDKDDADSLIRVITQIGEAEKYAGDAVGEHSRGGMVTKVRAAKIAKKTNGTYIVHGAEQRAIGRALMGEIGTRFELG